MNTKKPSASFTNRNTYTKSVMNVTVDFEKSTYFSNSNIFKETFLAREYFVSTNETRR